MKVVAVSDTHQKHFKLKDMPDGDLLVHTGDFTMGGYPFEIKNFSNWLGVLSRYYDHIVVIAGNHELTFESELAYACIDMLKEQAPDVIYLQDDSIEIGGYKIYGSPWQPEFFDWAFNLPRGEPLAKKWAQIPQDTDILLTHGPPMGILDTGRGGVHAGCADLYNRVKIVRPKLHVFGHFHECYGRHAEDDIIFVNASSCNSKYKLTNPPQVIQLP